MMMIQDDNTTGSVTPDALQNDADTTEDDADAMRLTMMGFRIMAQDDEESKRRERMRQVCRNAV